VRIDPDEPCPCGSGRSFRDCHEPLIEPGPEGLLAATPLNVISEPDPGTRAVFEMIGDDPLLMRGTDGPIALTCGACHTALVIGVETVRLKNIVIRCANCGSFNETPP
jgi:hypothetical protein